MSVTYSIAPACAGTPVGLAGYHTDFSTSFNPLDTQTLAGDQVSTAASGTLRVTVPIGLSSGCTILQSPYPTSGHGANSSGPPDNGAYNPTCSLPGVHGNQPATGSVGNADAKNPPGQAPNGSDNNAGYECDRNQGIGQGNPAHTSCAPSIGWQVDLFVGQLLTTVGPPNNYYDFKQPVSRLVDTAVG